METWLEKRSIHAMNLRSVFSAEQQRILERYYESGMTNQSKSCFQLILQCAQETKLDFSVVRTWVGNKRRKLASKADQNGAGAQALSLQHVSCGSAGVMRSTHPPVTHLLPPQASSSSSSSSSSSALSDVILTGLYANCFDATVHSRTVTKSVLQRRGAGPHGSADAVWESVIVTRGFNSLNSRCFRNSRTLLVSKSLHTLEPKTIIHKDRVTSDMLAPWLHSSSRKRPLQDRTQFSDRDVYTLKRYWDHGMTSLGSLCREKISAAASELRVDTEIITVRVYVDGNRRRKYRLMGIEIPPPKGGPVVFPDRSPHVLEDERQTPERVLVSLCLSDDGASDLYLTENDDVNDESDDDDDDDGDMLTTEMEQMQNLLEFRNEEVQFLENELQSQKQKFSELKRFTRSLLIAVKNKDRTKQQQLLASRPQRVRALGLENHSESGAETPTVQQGRPQGVAV
uniref:Homeobox domain-containing protein n=1 Tax=Cyprinus carpio carpio TaxID=630221 RepID=A0A8C1BNS5_CYPCA